MLIQNNEIPQCNIEFLNHPNYSHRNRLSKAVREYLAGDNNRPMESHTFSCWENYGNPQYQYAVIAYGKLVGSSVDADLYIFHTTIKLYESRGGQFPQLHLLQGHIEFNYDVNTIIPIGQWGHIKKTETNEFEKNTNMRVVKEDEFLYNTRYGDSEKIIPYLRYIVM